MLSKPVAILIHVPDVKLGLEWYKHAFPAAETEYLAESDFTTLNINGFSLEIVQADYVMESRHCISGL